MWEKDKISVLARFVHLHFLKLRTSKKKPGKKLLQSFKKYVFQVQIFVRRF